MIPRPCLHIVMATFGGRALLFGFFLGVLLHLYGTFSVKQDYFTLPTVGEKLTGRSLSVKFAQTPLACAKNCMRTGGCSAFSFSKSYSDCVLMRSSDITGTVPDGFYDTVIRKVTCSDNPCQDGGTCKDISTSLTEVIAYTCLCPCGRCGYNCDSLHFGHLPKACIYLFNAGYQNVSSKEECMAFCWETKGCRSADYMSEDGACWLNSVTSDEETLTRDCDKWYPSVSYLFFNCTCDDNPMENDIRH